MKPEKKERLERAGWRVGSAEEFLDLSRAESEFIELKLAFARVLRERRAMKKMTQAEFAKHLGSSQSRVAKMEAGDSSVSLDLLVKSLLASGAKTSDLARVMNFRKR